ncbi:MAG: flagellar brake protein [Spirochaetota bacterium]
MFEFLQGFRPSTIEIVAFVVLVALFAGALVWAGSRSARRERARRRAVAERRFSELLEQMALSRSDEGVIEQLANYLRDPDRKYLLLQNHTVFNDCADRAMADHAAAEGEVAALRVRLGFGGTPAGREPESSTEIPEDAGVMLVDTHNRTVPARVESPSPSAFRVRTDPDAPEVGAGSLIEVVYQNGSGIYRFESAVTNRAGRTLELSHAEHLERLQRRQYYRGEVRLPVYVRLAHESGRPERTELIDISAGGASFFAPDERFQAGEQVEMTFHPDSDAAMHLTGEVIRESKRGSIAHVSFENLRPGERDRVMRYVFRNAREKPPHGG